MLLPPRNHSQPGLDNDISSLHRGGGNDSTTVGRRRRNQEGGVCYRAGADARVPWRFSMTMSLSRSLKYDSSVPRSSHQRVFQSCGVRRGRGRRSPPSRATHLAFATRLQPPLPRTQYNVIHTHNTLCHTQCHTQCTAPLPVDVHRQARGSCYCCSTRPTHLACLRLHQPSGPAHQFSISWKQRFRWMRVGVGGSASGVGGGARGEWAEGRESCAHIMSPRSPGASPLGIQASGDPGFRRFRRFWRLLKRKRDYSAVQNDLLHELFYGQDLRCPEDA